MGPDPGAHPGPVRAALAAAERVLSRREGAGIVLADPEDLGGSERSVVARARVVRNPFSLPRTLVVKHYLAAPPPDRPDPFHYEVASCQLFTALPADGVYAGRFVIGGRQLPAAVSVGSNPTFSGTVRTVEAYVLDVDEDFYGHEVGVELVARLRGQERYDDLDALVTAIRGDVARTRALLG